MRLNCIGRPLPLDPIQSGVPPTGQKKSWGGITLIRFNEAGKIEAEIGEESEPGSIERMIQH
jgi:hypothetical protein